MSPTVGAHVCRTIARQVKKDDEIDLNQIVAVAAIVCLLYPDAQDGKIVDELAGEMPDDPQGFAQFCEHIADKCEAAAKGDKHGQA